MIVCLRSSGDHDPFLIFTKSPACFNVEWQWSSFLLWSANCWTHTVETLRRWWRHEERTSPPLGSSPLQMQMYVNLATFRYLPGPPLKRRRHQRWKTPGCAVLAFLHQVEPCTLKTRARWPIFQIRSGISAMSDVTASVYCLVFVGSVSLFSFNSPLRLLIGMRWWALVWSRSMIRRYHWLAPRRGRREAVVRAAGETEAGCICSFGRWRWIPTLVISVMIVVFTDHWLYKGTKPSARKFLRSIYVFI